MNWKYYIPHGWDEQRYAWEDFWLRPCDPNFSGRNIILTIDALGNGREPLLFALEDFEKRLELLGDKEYVINARDMIVRGIAFTKEEFLKWVRVWLEDSGYEVDELVEAPFEDFPVTSQHASIVGQCKVMEEELDAIDPAEFEKRTIARDPDDWPKKSDDEREEN